MTEFAHPEYLVEPSWLAEHLEDDGLVVLDVTARLTSALHNRAADDFATTHIPRSVFFDSAAGHGVLSDPDTALPWMWPEADRIALALRSAGVGPGTRVVITARTPRSGIDAGTMWCTRARVAVPWFEPVPVHVAYAWSACGAAGRSRPAGCGSQARRPSCAESTHGCDLIASPSTLGPVAHPRQGETLSPKCWTAAPRQPHPDPVELLVATSKSSDLAGCRRMPVE
ncbi:MAG: hypothetical protein O3C27_03760 [Actinomycetota bacterium]|nr:hypothetical protein [Actinomycetota bacterium]